MKVAGTSFPEHAVAQGTPTFAPAVPSDTTPYTNIRGLWCTGAGTLSLKNDQDVTVAVAALAGTLIPLSPSKILVATTGTYIILY